MVNKQNSVSLSASLYYREWLNVAFELHRIEKLAGKVSGTWKEWLEENVSIQYSYARKLCEIAKLLGKYAHFRTLGLSFLEVYQHKKEIQGMLITAVWVSTRSSNVSVLWLIIYCSYMNASQLSYENKYHSTLSAAFLVWLLIVPCVQSTVHFSVHDWIERLSFTHWLLFVTLCPTKWPLITSTHFTCWYTCSAMWLMCEDIPGIDCFSSLQSLAASEANTRTQVFLYKHHCYGEWVILFTLDTAFLQEHVLWKPRPVRVVGHPWGSPYACMGAKFGVWMEVGDFPREWEGP